MKKIFILTGEPSGDKLASIAISQLKSQESNIEFLAVGGPHLKSVGVSSIYDLNEVTYLGFTNVLFNIFKIKKKFNDTVDEIVKYNPDILFSVDSPDFTLRVAKKVKLLKPNIKTIHFVAPKVYVWREHRVKKLKSFLDHILLLFPFEKKYFDKENIKSTFVGHPLLDSSKKNNTDLSTLLNKNKKIVSIFPGSRLSEIITLMPILINFISLVQKEDNNFLFIFHSTIELKTTLKKYLSNSSIKNCEIVSDENIKQNILSKTIFAIVKSGTISLEICHAEVPSMIIYKMNFINFFIVKLLAKIRYANILNIVANSELIPELLQSKCNPNKIYEIFNLYIKDSDRRKRQVINCNKILNTMKIDIPAAKKIADILSKEI